VRTGFLPAVTAAPDGNLWFTESQSNRNIVGRIVP
jgi:hypothetical protein